MSYVKTAMLMGFMTALFMGIGLLLGGKGGMMMAFLFAMGTNLLSYWNSDKIALKMHGAVEVDRESAPEYYSIVEQLAANADLPMPGVYVIHSDQPNAFATGRNPANAAVAATTGLLDRLSKEEVAGVMAHELAHIKNRDTLIMTIAATMASAITMLINFAMFFRGGRSQGGGGAGIIGTLAAMFLAPMAAGLVQMAISRTREYEADRIGAEICTQPLWLASALKKIALSAKEIEMVQAEAHPGAAHMFIINPLSGRNMDKLFSTHPNTLNRIHELEKMAQKWGQMGGVREPGKREAPSSTTRGPWE